MQSVKTTHFHRVSNGFSLKSVVTVVRDSNFIPRTITTICITVLYFPHDCTLFSIQHPCYCMENTVHFVSLIRPHKVQYGKYSVQLCGKYSTVMQIVVIVLGVKLLSVITVTTEIHCLYDVKMSSLTLHMVHYPGLLCLHNKSESHHHNPGAFELQTFAYDTTVNLTTRN